MASRNDDTLGITLARFSVMVSFRNRTDPWNHEKDIVTDIQRIAGCDCCKSEHADKLVDNVFDDHLNFLCLSCYIQFVVKKDSLKTKGLMLEWHMTGVYPNPGEER